MNKKLKKILLIIVLCFCLIMPKVIADSDFSTDYGSSDSWESDYDSSWDYDYSGLSIPIPSFDITIIEQHPWIVTLFLFFWFLITFVVGYVLFNVTSKNTQKIKDLTQEEINEIDPTINKEKIIEELINIFKDIQIAWMNFDYATLCRLQTDEVYNNQVMKLELLKQENQKNIMEDITVSSSSIDNIELVDNKEIINLYLVVKMKDYIIDTNTNEIVKGNKRYIKNTYLITYERSIINKVCPNCGIELEDTNKNICEQCNSVLVKKYSKFILNKKVKISQINL